MDLLALTHEQGLSLLSTLDRRIKQTRLNYDERPELVAANSLLAILELLIADAERRIETEYVAAKSEEGSGNDDSRRVIAEEAKAVAAVVGACLGTLASQHGRYFEPFIPPLSRLARLVAPNTELIVQPHTTEGDHQITQPLNSYLAGEDAIKDEVGEAVQERIEALPSIVVLRYPQAQEGDSLQHSFFGHEIAHLALRHDHLADRLARDAYEKWSEAQAEEIPGEREAHLAERSLRWFTELASDRLGLRMVGPALYLALFEYASVSTWDYGPDLLDTDSKYNNYPALAWRLSLLGDQVDDYLPDDEGEPWAEIKTVVAAIKEQVPAWVDEDAAPEAEIVQSALRALESEEDNLLPPDELNFELRDSPGGADLTRHCARDAEYSPARFREELPGIWEMLDKEIIPAERVWHRGANTSWEKDRVWSVPLDWRSIINGAYLHWFVERSRGEVTAEDRKRLVRVVRGGVELSEIQLQALRLQKELDPLNLERG